MIYIASPYSHPDPAVRDARHLAVMSFTAKIMRQGQVPFSPIVHCHDIAIRFGLPGDFSFWQRYNFEMLRLATTLYILCLPGWEESIGVRAEFQYASTNCKHIMFWHQDMVQYKFRESDEWQQ